MIKNSLRNWLRTRIVPADRARFRSLLMCKPTRQNVLFTRISNTQRASLKVININASPLNSAKVINKCLITVFRRCFPVLRMSPPADRDLRRARDVIGRRRRYPKLERRISEGDPSAGSPRSTCGRRAQLFARTARCHRESACVDHLASHCCEKAGNRISRVLRSEMSLMK